MCQLIHGVLAWKFNIIISRYGSNKYFSGFRIYRDHHINITSGYIAYIPCNIQSAHKHIERLLGNIHMACPAFLLNFNGNLIYDSGSVFQVIIIVSYGAIGCCAYEYSRIRFIHQLIHQLRKFFFVFISDAYLVFELVSCFSINGISRGMYAYGFPRQLSCFLVF